MAITSIGLRTTAGTGIAGAGNNTAITHTPGATVAVGRILITAVTCRSAGDVASITDAVGNTWQFLAAYTNTTNGNVRTEVWMCVVATQLSSTTVITVAYDSGQQDVCCASWEYSVAAGKILAQAATALTSEVNGANGFGSSAFSGLASAARLYLRVGGKQANSQTTITQSANFTSWGLNVRSRNNASATLLRAEHRLNTSTGETSNPTLAVSGNTAGLFLALVEADPPRTATAELTGPAGTLSATAAVHVDAGAALTGPSGTLSAEVTVAQGNAVTLGNATTLVDPAGNQSISKPSGVVEGTILVLCCNHETDNFTPPSGFTKRGNTAHWTFPFDWYQELFTKVAGASEPSSYTMSGGGYRDAWLVALHNVDPSSVVPSGGVTDNSGSGSTTTGLSATVARDGSLLLRFEASHTGTGRSGSPPTGMSPVNGNSPIDGSFYADYQSGLSAGSTGNKTATLTGSESWAVNMLVLQPPAEGEPGDIEATAELTGPSGTASAEAAVLVAAGAAITGPAGTVAGTASVVAEAQAAIAGPSGTLAANAAVPIDAAAILTGPAGVASAAGSVRIGIAAELTGPAGVLAATVLSEEPGVEVSAALTGPAGTLAAAATVAVSGALAATGPAGQLSAAAALPVAATAALVGPSGTLAATTDVPAAAVCALVGPSPSLSAVCAVRVAVAATITGPAGVLSASVGEPPRETTVAIVGPSGTITANVGVVIVATVTLVGAPGTCTAAVGAIAGTGASLVGPSGVVAAGAGVVAQGSLGIVGPAGVLSALIVEHIEPPLTRAPPTTSALVPGAAGGSRMLPVPRATSRSVS